MLWYNIINITPKKARGLEAQGELMTYINTNKANKILALIMAILTVFGAVCIFGARNVSAAPPLTEAEFAAKMEWLRTVYPDGMYWTKTNGTDADGISMAGPNQCTNHYAVYSTCGEYAGWGWQCFGYANVLAAKTFGTYATRSSDGYNRGSGWNYYSSVSTYCAGDYVRLYGTNNGHSVFITKVEGNKITISDCNRVGLCQIDWDMVYDRSYFDQNAVYVLRYTGNNLTGTGTPYSKLTTEFNMNGGSITPSSEYVVSTEGDHLNVRSDTSTSSAIVTSIPDKTVIYVIEAREANGYLWGYVELDNGYKGWCALKDYGRNEDNAVYNGFNSSDGLILKGNSTYRLSVSYDGKSKLILPAAEELGLARDGFKFIGWSDKASGGNIFKAGEELAAEALLANGDDTDKSLTLYAVWEDLKPTLEIYVLPEKRVYEIGESLSTLGLKLRLVYENGDTRVIDSGFTVSGFDSVTAGEKTVTVAYDGQTVNYTVTVEAYAAAVVLTPVTKEAGKIIEVEIALDQEVSAQTVGVYGVDYDRSRLKLLGGEWSDKDADIANWNVKTEEGALAYGENQGIGGRILTLRFEVTGEGAFESEVALIVKAIQKEEGSEGVALRIKQAVCRLSVGGTVKGDVDGNGSLNADDAIYLLYHSMFGNTLYPISQDCDFDGDGQVTPDDAVHLLYGMTFGFDKYPLAK